MFDSTDDNDPAVEARAKPDDVTSGSPGWERILAWLRAQERWVLLATVAFQVVVLCSMIASKAAILWSGDVVLLRVVPVDPRDMFRGDYVTLGYEIGRVPPQGVEGLSVPLTRATAPQWQGRQVYVTLAPESDGLHYQAGPVSTSSPPRGTRFIAGKLGDGGRITFGIESYFVQEGKGKAYEAAIREHRLSAEVSLSASGQATLRGLRIE
jgi:uncharacterized membrane-anchored protein